MSLTRTASSIVPAQPGWSVLIPSYDDTGKVADLIAEPAIAWRVRAWSDQPIAHGIPGTEVADCAPITADQLPQPLDSALVLVRPNGHMFSPEGEIPDTDAACAFYEAAPAAPGTVQRP